MKENNSAITDFDTLSYSKASSFENCERKFSFSYVEKIRTESGIHAAVGTFVHEIIEEFYNQNNFFDYIKNDSDKELAYLSSLFEKNWSKQKNSLQRLYNKEKRTPVEYKSLEEWVKTLIKNYIELEIFISQNSDLYPDLQITQNISIFNEKKFTKYFNHDNHNKLQSFELQGYIDRLIFSNDLLHCSIVDIKTGKPSSFGKEDKKDQIRTYQYLVTNGNSEDFDTTKNFVVTSGYLFYLGGKNIDPKKRIVKVSEDDFNDIDNFINNKFEKTLENVLSKRNLDIEIYDSEGVKSPWKTKKQVLCGWCDYKSVCDEWVEKIIDSNSVYPVNQAFKKLRHSGGVDNISKFQSTKTITAFQNTDKTLSALLTYFDEIFKPFLKTYLESLKTQKDIDDDVKLVESNLKKFIKQASSEDELINSELKKILLKLVGDKENDTDAWELVINGINLINNNKDKVDNIDFKEFESFLVSARKKWKNSFEKNKNSLSFIDLINMVNTIYNYKFFNIKLKTPIKNFKNYLNDFVNLIHTVDKNLDKKDGTSVLSSKNKEVELKINKLLNLLENYQNSLESFSKLKIK